MKNAIILHGTDFNKDHMQHQGNWFPWLKHELEKIGYEVYLPELPNADQPDLEKYWEFLSNFNFNKDTILVGHSSGGSAVFGILHKLPVEKKIRLAISVAGFYKDEGWNCEGLFKESFDWNKIKNQAKEFYVIYSDDDPYVKPYQAEYFAKNLGIEPTLMKGKKHFSLEGSPEFTKFPELLALCTPFRCSIR